MKYETTKKAILSNYSNIIKVGYCYLETLLKFHSPSAYTASKTYGWRADVYEITPDTVIVTGYAPFGNIVPDYETVKKYEEKAEELCEKRWPLLERIFDTGKLPTGKFQMCAKVPVPYDEALANNKRDLDTLLREFIREVTPN